MRYFLLTQSEQLIKPLVVDGLDPAYYPHNISDKDWERIPDVIVAYFQNSPACEPSVVLRQPTMLLENQLKELLVLYDPSIQCKAIQVFSNNIEERLGYLYWVVKCQEADCLHEDTKVYPNGMVEEIILDKEKIPESPVFKVGSIAQNTLVISLPVAESILRRNWLGIGFKELNVH